MEEGHREVKTYLECYPCFIRQALDAARYCGADEHLQKEILDRVLELLGSIKPGSTPPEIGNRVHRIVRAVAGNSDPYTEVKETCTREALNLFPRWQAYLRESENNLDTAIRLSVAGNIIDFGPASAYDLNRTVDRVLEQPFAIDDQEPFREKLADAERILILADNAGETVLDRLLIEALDVPVLYAVKDGPILNDATMDDAIDAGIDQVAEIISTGAATIGTILEACCDEFRTLYESSDLVLSKGQANYETLSEMGSKIFFLLQTKCPVIARDVGVPMNSIVFMQGKTV
jgi:uncharacterized protein with ATP-grasp and redox domains